MVVFPFMCLSVLSCIIVKELGSLGIGSCPGLVLYGWSVAWSKACASDPFSVCIVSVSWFVGVGSSSRCGMLGEYRAFATWAGRSMFTIFVAGVDAHWRRILFRPIAGLMVHLALCGVVSSHIGQCSEVGEELKDPRRAVPSRVSIREVGFSR